MCKDLGALTYLSIKENKDSEREGTSKRKNDRRGSHGPDNDLGGHNKNSELFSNCDGMALEGFEQTNDML